MAEECLDLTFLKEIRVGLSEAAKRHEEEGTPGIPHWGAVQQRGAQDEEDGASPQVGVPDQ